MGEMDNLVEVRREGQEYRVIVAGAGLGGLCATLTFMKAGIGPIATLEKSHEVGGVWSANTYPGCACDIPAHLYSLSFETDMDWSCFYPKQSELLEYQKKVVAKHRLQERNILQLNSEVVDARWKEETQRWEVLVRDARDQSLRLLVTQFLVPSTGALFDPIIPNLEGRELFQGPTMHTARWDHTVDFRGKRVAVIGTGASSIQVVASLAPVCGHLTVFQRTPAWVLPKYNFRFPNWATLVMRYVPGQRWLFRQLLFWQREIHMAPAFFRPGGIESRLLTLTAKRNISKVVKDRDLRKALTPDYTLGCKRVLVSDHFYPTMVRDNVSLVSSGVTGVTRDGVKDAEGKVHPLDIIVWATGFNLKAIYHQMEAYGRGGKSWIELMGGEGAMWAHLGVTSPGLPNMFLMSGPNTGLGHNSVILMFEAQAKYISDIINQMDEEGASVAEVRREEWEAYSTEMKQRLTSTVWKKGGCSSWYLGEEGKFSDVLWPSSVLEYQRRLGQADMSPFDLLDRHNRPLAFTGKLRRRRLWQTGLRLGLSCVLLAVLLWMAVPRVWPKAGMPTMADGSSEWAPTNDTCPSPSRWPLLGLLWHAVTH